MNRIILAVLIIFSFSSVAASQNTPMKRGVTYNSIGNTTFGSSGTSCTKVGRFTFCN